MRFLSIGEAAAVLDLTPRQIRYLGLGSTRAVDGAARIFDAADLTVLRVYAELVKRFRHWDLELWRARAAVLYLAPALYDAVRHGRRMGLVVDAARGLCELRPWSKVGPRDMVLNLDVLHAEMRSAVRERRTDEPELWTGRAFVRRPELVAV